MEEKFVVVHSFRDSGPRSSWAVMRQVIQVETEGVWQIKALTSIVRKQRLTLHPRPFG